MVFEDELVRFFGWFLAHFLEGFCRVLREGFQGVDFGELWRAFRGDFRGGFKGWIFWEFF